MPIIGNLDLMMAKRKIFLIKTKTFRGGAVTLYDEPTKRKNNEPLTRYCQKRGHTSQNC